MGAPAAYRLAVRVRDKAFSLLAGRSFAAFGRRSVIQLPVRLSGERRIDVGDGVFVGAGSWLQVLEGPDTGVALTIGDGTSIAGSCVLSAAVSIRLGRKVLFARNVYVADHAHRFDDPTRAVLDQGIDDLGPVEIGDGAWLGQNVVVCPGVTIGRGAVIGANSVVLDDVPDFGVAVGAPARVVRVREPEAVA
jgi:acetyltransferase-like isoleucine patch superfamily enzyme